MRKLTQIKRSIIRRFPGLEAIQLALYRFKPYRSKFRAYYLDRGWGDRESASGPGSSLKATEAIREELPGLFRRLGIGSVIDVPCGDFHWMSRVDLAGIDYLGVDIVPELVADIAARYGRPGVRFACRDMMTDPLGPADLVICRDCLFHYPNGYILRGLAALRATGAAYLLTTTFARVDRNAELESIGLFRPINLVRPPFDLPEPIALLAEESGSLGKSLGLWRFADIPSRRTLQ